MTKVVQVCFEYTTSASVCSMSGTVIANLDGMKNGQDYYKRAVADILCKSPTITGWKLRAISKLKKSEDYVITNVLGLINKDGVVIYNLPQNMLVSEILKLV